MISKLLALTRPLIILDCETTGLRPEKDRIVEIGFQIHYHDDRPVREWRTLVDPECEIPRSVSEVHGIFDIDIKRCAVCGLILKDDCLCETPKRWPFFREIASNLAKGFSDCDFAGKNVRFDLRMVAAEMERADVEWSYAGARIICADRLEHLGEPRTLSDLYRKHCGKEPVDAHEALSDVRMTADVIAVQLQRYNMPRSLDDLHALQWPGWIDPEGKFRFVDGVPHFGNWSAYAGQPMRAADAGFWDYVLRNKFSRDVKELARAAKLGRYPEKR